MRVSRGDHGRTCLRKYMEVTRRYCMEIMSCRREGHSVRADVFSFGAHRRMRYRENGKSHCYGNTEALLTVF